MRKDDATGILVAIESVRSAHNELAAQIEKLEDGEQKRLLRRAIASIMADTATELERPILLKYPDLDRDSK